MSNGGIDGVREIIDVAVSVLEDYCDDDASETRIARLARWIVYNLAVDVIDKRAGSVAIISTMDKTGMVVQAGDSVALQVHGTFDGEGARQLATALLLCAERAEVL